MQRQAPARRTPAAPAGHPHRTQCGRASHRPWTHNSHPQGDPHRHRRQIPCPATSPARSARIHRHPGTQPNRPSSRRRAVLVRWLRRPAVAGHAASGPGRPRHCRRPPRMRARPRRRGGQHAAVAGAGRCASAGRPAACGPAPGWSGWQPPSSGRFEPAAAGSALPLVPDAPASFVASLNRVRSCGYFSKCGGLKQSVHSHHRWCLTSPERCSLMIRQRRASRSAHGRQPWVRAARASSLIGLPSVVSGH